MTVKGGQSHAAAASGNIVTAAVFKEDMIVLSSLGKKVLADPRIKEHVTSKVRGPCPLEPPPPCLF